MGNRTTKFDLIRKGRDMTNKFLACRKAILLVIAAAVLIQSAPAFAETRTYFKPKYGGFRLDWCFTWAQNCGRPVADHYCQIKGFKRALQYKIAHNVGVPNYVRTRLISPGGGLCNAYFCDSFKYIQCQR